MIASVGAAQTRAVQNNPQQRLQDKLDIQSLIVRYGTALDTLNADLYAGVFTTDAELDVAGNVRKGRQQIREIVTGLQRTRDENKAKGTPSPALYHVISNTAVEILNDVEARHRSYWQTVRVGPNNQVTVGAIGPYEDVIVKTAGQWLIRSRKIMPFTDGTTAAGAQTARPAPPDTSPAVRLQRLEDMDHILSNFEIVVNGDSATAWSRWTFITPGADGKPVISQAGRYDDALVRENGRWRFQRRVASNDIPAPR
jgi:uncharacterized protein (TIGR02246 family)